MSSNCLLNNYQNIKSWSKQLDQDFSSFWNANDFELALQDYSWLNNKNRYRDNLHELNWFMFDKPSLYTFNIDAYASYLTYVIIIQMYHNRNFTISYYEAYFSEQLVGFLEAKKDFQNLQNFAFIRKYWEKTFLFLEYLVNSMSQYDRVVSNTSIYFNCNGKDNYKVNIPFLGINEDKPERVDCHLILNYTGSKPSWYTVASIYKIYRYFAEHNISVDMLYIYWLDMNDRLAKVEVDSIPLTENVAELVSRYSEVEPYPYRNIFNKSNSMYYNKTPLELILK